VHQRLTTQEAADLLGISRPTLVKLLEAGEIPFEQPGRHRRVRLADVLSYRERASAERRAALDHMVEIADEADLYELTATPKRTR
jgi:excisionase family DNA binding protein